jgi:hypothetical protein
LKRNDAGSNTASTTDQGDTMTPLSPNPDEDDPLNSPPQPPRRRTPSTLRWLTTLVPIVIFAFTLWQVTHPLTQTQTVSGADLQRIWRAVDRGATTTALRPTAPAISIAPAASAEPTTTRTSSSFAGDPSTNTYLPTIASLTPGQPSPSADQLTAIIATDGGKDHWPDHPGHIAWMVLCKDGTAADAYICTIALDNAEYAKYTISWDGGTTWTATPAP